MSGPYFRSKFKIGLLYALLAAALGIMVFFAAGCVSAPGGKNPIIREYPPLTITITNSGGAPVTIPVTVTNVVPETGQTVVAYVPNTNANPVYYVNPQTTQLIATGQTLTPLIPGGGGLIADGLLGLLSAGLAGFATWKTKQAASRGKTLDAVIVGIENANPPDAKIVKQSIATHASAAGVGPELSARVRDLTG